MCGFGPHHNHPAQRAPNPAPISGVAQNVMEIKRFVGLFPYQNLRTPDFDAVTGVLRARDVGNALISCEFLDFSSDFHSFFHKHGGL